MSVQITDIVGYLWLHYKSIFFSICTKCIAPVTRLIGMSFAFLWIFYIVILLFYLYSMTQFHILATIALLSCTATTYAATVSWEITTRGIANTPVWVITSIKKPIQKGVVRTQTRMVSYMSPAGKEYITFSLRTKDGIIVNASAIPRATNQISLTLQKAFAKNISQTVVGKKIKNLTLSAVAWASLTTDAFELFIKKTI